MAYSIPEPGTTTQTMAMVNLPGASVLPMSTASTSCPSHAGLWLFGSLNDEGPCLFPLSVQEKAGPVVKRIN